MLPWLRGVLLQKAETHCGDLRWAAVTLGNPVYPTPNAVLSQPHVILSDFRILHIFK